MGVRCRFGVWHHLLGVVLLLVGVTAQVRAGDGGVQGPLTLDAAMRRAVAVSAAGADAGAAARARLEVARAFLGALLADRAYARHEEMATAEFLRARRLERRAKEKDAALEIEIAEARAAYRRALAERVRAETEQRLQRLRLAALLGLEEPPGELVAPVLRAERPSPPELEGLLAWGADLEERSAREALREAIARAWQRLVVLEAERDAVRAAFEHRDLALDRARTRYEQGQPADLARAMAEVSAVLHEQARVEYGILLAWLELAALGAVEAEAWRRVVEAGAPEG